MKSFREQRQAQTERNNGVTADVEALSHMSESDLRALLQQEAAKARANGTLTTDTLRSFYDQMAPMLSEDQRQKMRELLSLIAK